MNQITDSAHDSALDLFSLESERAAPGHCYGHLVMRVYDFILLNTPFYLTLNAHREGPLCSTSYYTKT